MPKTKLTLEDIEQIKKSKGNLSASEVQRKYNIGVDYKHYGMIKLLHKMLKILQNKSLHNLHNKI